MAILPIEKTDKTQNLPRAAQTPANANEVHLVVDWVPNQLCVVCGVKRLIRLGESEDEDLQRLYGEILDELNPRIRAALNRDPEDLTRALNQFKTVNGRVEESCLLRTDFPPGSGPVLQRVTFTPTDGSRQPPRPWSYLRYPPENRPSTHPDDTVLFFYTMDPKVGTNGNPDEDLHNQVDRVRELSNLVNVDLIGAADAIDGDGWTIRAAHPNWLMTAVQGEGPCAGAVAVPGEEGNYTFKFQEKSLNFPPDDWSDKDVLVAVLDTSPPVDQIGKAAASAPTNALLNQISAEIQAGAAPRFIVESADPASPFSQEYALSGLERLLPDWEDQLPHPYPNDPPDLYRIDDHGLFVSGIIRSIAPAAEIHLIKVVNDYGVGDLRLVARVLQLLPNLMVARQKRLMVVNLSLGADIPPGDVLMENWCPVLFDQISKGIQHAFMSNFNRAIANFDQPGFPFVLGPRLTNLIPRLHLGLSEVVAWLSDGLPNLPIDGTRVRPGVLIVAAAGNDNDPGGPHQRKEDPRPEPRYPAHYDQVLGVAAINAKGTASTYSNRGDEPAGPAFVPNGVATFGGDATRRSPTNLPRITDPSQAIVGIFSADTLPVTGKPNPSHWVRWAGTSFSTPIISAIAAKLWGHNQNWDRKTLIEEIRNLATGANVPELDVPSIPVDQV
jgi:hypothetical protein